MQRDNGKYVMISSEACLAFHAAKPMQRRTVLMLISCGLLAARPYPQCQVAGLGQAGSTRSQRPSACPVNRKAQSLSNTGSKPVGRHYSVRQLSMGQVKANTQSIATASAPDLADPFGGAMPKEEIGALRFLKVCHAHKL